MINKPPPFKGRDRIPGIIPIKGRGLINQGSTLTINPDNAFSQLLHDSSRLLIVGPRLTPTLTHIKINLGRHITEHRLNDECAYEKRWDIT